MPDAAKHVVKSRTESHSDLAESSPSRAYQAALTERHFGAALLRHLRDVKGDARLRNLNEEWLATDDGMVHEISVEVVTAE